MEMLLFFLLCRSKAKQYAGLGRAVDLPARSFDLARFGVAPPLLNYPPSGHKGIYVIRQQEAGFHETTLAQPGVTGQKLSAHVNVNQGRIDHICCTHRLVIRYAQALPQ